MGSSKSTWVNLDLPSGVKSICSGVNNFVMHSNFWASSSHKILELYLKQGCFEYECGLVVGGMHNGCWRDRHPIVYTCAHVVTAKCLNVCVIWLGLPCAFSASLSSLITVNMYIDLSNVSGSSSNRTSQNSGSSDVVVFPETLYLYTMVLVESQNNLREGHALE